MKSATVFFICLCVAFTTTQAQQPPGFGFVFPQQEVTNIYITLDPDSLDWMLANLENEHEFPATFVFESQSLSDTVSLVGFRLRGNTSLNAAKKSFKISFNTFDAGADWQQLEKINLLATVNDPSLMRSKLSHDIYRKAGIAAARTSYTNLYINSEYRGVYLNVEHIDEQMTAKNFDHQGDGNLYKCTYPADLDFISNTPDDYKFALWGYRHYELKNNDYLDDYTDLAAFIATLNNTSAANLPCVLPEKFHVSEYLKIAALDVLLGNWDGYIFNKNNFYVYHDQLTDRLRYIPYDLDNTLGIDWFGMDWSERAIYTWSQQGEERPLYTRLMQNSDYRTLFSKHIDELCSTYFHPDSLAEQIAHWHSLLAPHVAEDPYYPLDFGYDLNDFNNAAWEGCCNHVPLGIVPFVEARRASALQQLESYDASSTDPHWIVQRIDTNAVSLKARVEGNVSSLQANYSWDGAAYNSGTMSESAMHLYDYDGPTFNTASDKLYYRGIINGTATFPCTPQFHWMTRSTIDVHINEACASNQTLIADNAGEYDDWVELYNATGSAVSLSGCFLTDDASNWNRWQLPDTLLPAFDFLLLWLDDDQEQGRHHANFKLSAGEELMLYRVEDGKPRIVDRASGFSPVTNQTWALLPDGGSESGITSGTPGGSNMMDYVDALNESEAFLYPNPANTVFFWPEQTTASIFDIHGNLVASDIHYGENNCDYLSNGIYAIIAQTGVYRLSIVR